MPKNYEWCKLPDSYSEQDLRGKQIKFSLLVQWDEKQESQAQKGIGWLELSENRDGNFLFSIEIQNRGEVEKKVIHLSCALVKLIRKSSAGSGVDLLLDAPIGHISFGESKLSSASGGGDSRLSPPPVFTPRHLPTGGAQNVQRNPDEVKKRIEDESKDRFGR